MGGDIKALGDSFDYAGVSAAKMSAATRGSATAVVAADRAIAAEGGAARSAATSPVQHLTQRIIVALDKDGRRAIGEAAAEFQGKEIQLIRS